MKVSPTMFKNHPSALLLVLIVLLLSSAGRAQAQTASAAPITGEIERLTLNSQTDPWSGGVIVVGGQNIILPRNLLMDLPANRLTLTQIFAQAPPACLQRAESGLAKHIFVTTTKPAPSPLYTLTVPVPETSSPATSLSRRVLRR